MAIDPSDAPPALYKVRWGNFQSSGTATKLLPYDPNRLVLIVSSGTSAQAIGAALGAGDGTGFGFSAGTNLPVVFSYSEHGDIVFQELWCGSGGSLGSLSWVTLSRI